MDPLQRMGAIRKRDQTADKNITMFLPQEIQTTHVHRVKWIFACLLKNESIIKAF